MSEAFVSIEGRVLTRALKLVAMVTERRNTYPILGKVRLTAQGSQLILRATDLDMDFTITLDVTDARGELDLCVDPRILNRIGRAAGGASLIIEPIAGSSEPGKERDPRLKLGFDQSASYELEALNADKWPSIAGGRAALLEQFADGALRRQIHQVDWCTSLEETRYYLNGVCWQRGKYGSRMASTDGHRMALCRYSSLPIDDAVAETRIIPNKAVRLLKEIAAGAVEAYGVLDAGASAPSALKLEFATPGMILRTKLIDGQYPDFLRVMPDASRFQAEFRVRQDEFTAAIDRAMVFDAPGNAGGRCLAFTGKEGEPIAIGVKRADVGQANITMHALWPQNGKPFGVNGRYLRDLIDHCTGEVVLHQVEPSAPITVLDADPAMTRLIMPMRV